MTGGIIIGEMSGPPQVIGGIPIGPGAPMGTISVTIGTYNPTTGLLGILSRSKPRDASTRTTAPTNSH